MNQNPNMSNPGISANQPLPNPQPPSYMNQGPYSMSEMNDVMKYRMTYPEIYYKCQPFVMMACDQLDTLTSEMPTQEMIEKISDNIYDDICRMYPDMAEYVRSIEQKGDADIPVQGILTQDRDRDRDRFRRRFRRRGLFRDLLDILLLSEFFRRRRRIF